MKAETRLNQFAVALLGSAVPVEVIEAREQSFGSVGGVLKGLSERRTKRKGRARLEVSRAEELLKQKEKH